MTREKYVRDSTLSMYHLPRHRAEHFIYTSAIIQWQKRKLYKYNIEVTQRLTGEVVAFECIVLII